MYNNIIIIRSRLVLKRGGIFFACHEDVSGAEPAEILTF